MTESKTRARLRTPDSRRQPISLCGENSSDINMATRLHQSIPRGGDMLERRDPAGALCACPRVRR